MQTAVSGFNAEFEGRIVILNTDATIEDSKREVAELGFNNHGLVIRSPQGEVLWSQPDHEVNIEQVRAQIGEILKQR